MVVLFGNDDCSRILRIEVTGTDSEAVGHEAAHVCQGIGVDCGNTHIHIENDRCMIKALPVEFICKGECFQVKK